MTCEECGAEWDSRAAADECATLDTIEAREARRPRKTPTPQGATND